MSRRYVKNRPPLRICPICGGDHYAWQESAPCKRCARAEVAEREAGIGAVLREERLKRRERLGL